ncbi:MAG TPA: hypothetical protein VH396_03940 [Chitinophagaceae bacterium]|jgi:hypothetical protein
MPTLIQIANELAVSFAQTQNKQHAANHLIIEINSLKYRHSKKLIEYNVKAAILYVIKCRLPGHSKESILFSKAEDYILKKLDTNNESKTSNNLNVASLTLYKTPL